MAQNLVIDIGNSWIKLGFFLEDQIDFTCATPVKSFSSDCIIIDIGTAVTADFVAKEGRYKGGMIYPGRGLSAKMLADYTDKLPLVTIVEDLKELVDFINPHLTFVGLHEIQKENTSKP